MRRSPIRWESSHCCSLPVDARSTPTTPTGWPPFTRVITPVVSTVSAEYLPSEEEYRKDRGGLAQEEREGGKSRS